MAIVNPGRNLTAVLDVRGIFSRFLGRRTWIDSRFAWKVDAPNGYRQEEFWIAQGTPVVLSQIVAGYICRQFMSLSTTETGLTVSITIGGNTIVLPINQLFIVGTSLASATVTLTNTEVGSATKNIRVVRA